MSVKHARQGAGPGRYASCRSTITAVPKKGPRTGPARGGQRKGTVIRPAGSSRVSSRGAARRTPRSERAPTRSSAVDPATRRVARSSPRRNDRRHPHAMRRDAMRRTRCARRIERGTVASLRARDPPASARIAIGSRSCSRLRSVLTVIDRHGMKCDEMIATKIRSLSHHTQQADSVASILPRARASGLRSPAASNDANAPRRVGGLLRSHVRS